MQLGQNSTEAVVARACDFYKQYVMFDIIDIIACHRERHRQWEDHFLRRDWNNKIMMMAIGISTMIMVMVCHGNDPCQDRKYSLTFLN